MKIFRKVNTLQQELHKLSKAGKSIGFTPTMGALHSGHLALIERAMKENDISVVSIFVNPTQFNQKKDLKSYPRPLNKDKALLRSIGNQILFTPFVKEVYPPDVTIRDTFEFDGLDEEMEGKFRPGHFAGVAQVVYRFLDIIKPTKLYMGQKDFQQFTIIQKMIDGLQIPTDLVVCPIERAKSGLAKSSRNVRLSAENKDNAKIIYETLLWVKSNIEQYPVKELCELAMTKLAINENFKPEYVFIADGNTLKPLAEAENHSYIVVCAAVWAGDVRLIDNMIIRQ